MKRSLTVLLSLAASTLLLAGAAGAQSLPGLGGQLSGGTSGLLGQALPSVSSAGVANTSGVLSYCIKNNVLKGNVATSALSSLTGRSGVQSSNAFNLGQQGQLETGKGGQFSVAGLKGQAKTKLCDMVLQHARSLL